MTASRSRVNVPALNNRKDPVDNPSLQGDLVRAPVGQILTHEGRELALVDLGHDASTTLRASWSTDQPFQSGGVVDSTWLLPTLGAGSTAASSLLAGNVFLATANPATLMTIGSGVGSAVVGPTGIVAQAPFIAASSALMPVVAPVMLFTTVSSVMLCARLDRAQQTLGRLSEWWSVSEPFWTPRTTPDSRPPPNTSTKSGPSSNTPAVSRVTCPTGSQGSITKWAFCVPSTGS